MPLSVSHDFLNQRVADDGAPHVWHGYPDESRHFVQFVDSLVGVIQGEPWGVQRSILATPKAIVVDFVSQRYSQAESAVAHGWNGAREFPMGVVNAVHSRTETNEQNARIGRHMALIATGLKHAAFCNTVVDKLLDSRTCANRHCEVCGGRLPRSLADAMQILADGTNLKQIHLFAKWSPSRDLLNLLAADGIMIRSHPLSDIPTEALESNRFYHIWDGTPKQAVEFRDSVWTPTSPRS